MPHTDTHPSLPFAGKTPRSRQSSYLAAVSASEHRAVKRERYLTWLETVGSATDHGAAEHFDWPLSSVCSTRNGAVDLGYVTALGDCLGRYGKRVTVWCLTEAGVAAVKAIKGAA
jgi:hypothetical protein